MNETTAHPPDIQPAKGTWLVWIIPIVALAIGSYLIYKEYASRGPLITIEFSDGSGLDATKTKLFSKGVVVGDVESVALNPDAERVLVTARLQKPMAGLAREGSRFWIVRPEISMSGVQGLETIMTGPSINVEPGEGQPTLHFAGLHTVPRTTEIARQYILRTPRRISVHPGVPVLFRGLEVGNVSKVDLSPDSTEVWVTVFIDSPYEQLIRNETRFWDAGGVQMKVNLLGARIRTGSLESVLSGSIEFATPPESVNGAIPESDTQFILHSEVEDKWLGWQAAIPLTDAGDH